MRSQSMQCSGLASGYQGVITTRIDAVNVPRFCHLRHSPQNAGSIDSSRTGWGDCHSSGLHRQGSCKCRASSDQTSGSQKPISGTSNSASPGKSSWGSSWGKRSGGSVFKKQGKQESARHEKPSQSSPEQQAAASDRLDPQLEASIRMNVERANQTLEEIVQAGAVGRWSGSCNSHH
jgi:hypothetical protein